MVAALPTAALAAAAVRFVHFASLALLVPVLVFDVVELVVELGLPAWSFVAECFVVEEEHPLTSVATKALVAISLVHVLLTVISVLALDRGPDRPCPGL